MVSNTCVISALVYALIIAKQDIVKGKPSWSDYNRRARMQHHNGPPGPPSYGGQQYGGRQGHGWMQPPPPPPGWQLQYGRQIQPGPPAYGGMQHHGQTPPGPPAYGRMQHHGVDTSNPVNVLHAQMKDMQRGSTVVTYQLASPANRRMTARPGGYNWNTFNTMVHHSMYKPMLSGNGYKVMNHGYMDSHRNQYYADVMVYKTADRSSWSNYRFIMSRQHGNVVDQHTSLGPYQMRQGHTPVWRTDNVEIMQQHGGQQDHGRQTQPAPPAYGNMKHHIQTQPGPPAYGGMQHHGVDTSNPVNVLHAQMRDMQRGSTVVTYQLASPANRRMTARPGGYNWNTFNTMVHHSMYKPMLSGNGYKVMNHGYMDSHKNQYYADVMVYKTADRSSWSNYRFIMSRQHGNVVDQHTSLGPYRMRQGHAPVWRTDAVHIM